MEEDVLRGRMIFMTLALVPIVKIDAVGQKPYTPPTQNNDAKQLWKRTSSLAGSLSFECRLHQGMLHHSLFIFCRQQNQNPTLPHEQTPPISFEELHYLPTYHVPFSGICIDNTIRIDETV